MTKEQILINIQDGCIKSQNELIDVLKENIERLKSIIGIQERIIQSNERTIETLKGINEIDRIKVN